MITEVMVWHARGGEPHAVFAALGMSDRGYDPGPVSMHRLQHVVYKMVMMGNGFLRPWMSSSGNVGWVMERVECKERKEEER